MRGRDVNAGLFGEASSAGRTSPLFVVVDFVRRARQKPPDGRECAAERAISLATGGVSASVLYGRLLRAFTPAFAHAFRADARE